MSNRKHVKILAAKNWQGSTFEKNFKPLTAIVGPNMGGKSTYTNALRVALLGYSPTVGNKLGLTFGFIGNPDGCDGGYVSAKFSDGTWQQHTWKLNRGKIEYKGPESPMKIPPVLLDLQKEFFGKSGPQQANIVFQKMDLEALGFTCEAVTAKLKTDVKVEAPTKETESALGLIVDDVEALDSERLENSWTWPYWMEKVVESIILRRDAAKATLENMTGVIQGTAQLKAADALKAPFDPKELADQRAKLAELVAAAKNFQSAKQESDRRGRFKTGLVKALAEVPDYTDAIKALEADITQIQNELSTFTEPSPEIEEGKTKERDWLAEQVTELKTRIQLKSEEIKKLEAQLSADKKSKCCPRCASKGTGWKKTLERDAAAIDNEKKGLATLEKDYSERVTQKENIDAWFTDLENKRASQRGGQRLANKKREGLDGLIKAMGKCRVNVPMGESFMEKSFTVEEAKAQLKALEEVFPEPSADTVPTPETIDAQRAKVEELEQAERDHLKGESDKLRAAEAQKEHDTAKAEHEVAAKAFAVLKTIKADMMEQAFGGFMKRVNLFTDGIMKAPLTFRDGEIGYFRGAAWVGWEFLSGTEKMLASIGLAVALAQESPLRIVFVDEWLRDHATRALVLSRLSKLVCDDVIDQAVFLDTDRGGLETAGFHVIEV